MHTKAINSIIFSLICLASQASLNGMNVLTIKNADQYIQQKINNYSLSLALLNDSKQKNTFEKEYASKKYGIPVMLLNTMQPEAKGT